MQVILLQDVGNVGRKYEEVEVADGYGTNYLIPNGLAQVATEATRNRYKKQQEKVEKERQKKREALAEAIEKLDGGQVTITADKVGDQGQLFAGIYPQDIAEAVNDEFGVGITGSDIDRDQPIQKVGDEEIEISILDTTVTLSATVKAADDATSSSEPESTDEEAEDSDEEEDEPEKA